MNCTAAAPECERGGCGRVRRPTVRFAWPIVRGDWPTGRADGEVVRVVWTAVRKDGVTGHLVWPIARAARAAGRLTRTLPECPLMAERRFPRPDGDFARARAWRAR